MTEPKIPLPRQLLARHIRRNLKDAELTDKFAPMDIVRSFSRVRAFRDGKWVVAEIMKKDRQLVEAAGLNITPIKGVL